MNSAARWRTSSNQQGNPEEVLPAIEWSIRIKVVVKL